MTLSGPQKDREPTHSEKPIPMKDQVVYSLQDLAALHGISTPADEDAIAQEEDASTKVKKLWAQAREASEFPALARHSFTDDASSGPIVRLTPELALHARSLQWPRQDRGDQEDSPEENATSRFERELGEIVLALNPNARFTINGRKSVEFDLTELSGFPSLPEGYGFKGGVARKALALALQVDIQTAAVRDMDLVRVGPGDRKTDKEVSERFMLDDFLINKRNGVEVVKDLHQLLWARDVTMNELVFLDNRLVASPRCVLDTIGGVVRPSFSPKGRRFARRDIRVAIKAARFYAEGIAEGREMQIQGFAPSRRNRENLFYLALHLDRALANSREAGEIFLKTCKEDGLASGVSLGKGLDKDIRAIAKANRLELGWFTNYENN